MIIMLAKRLGTMVLTMIAVSFILFISLELNVEGVARQVLGPYAQQQQLDIWLQQNGYMYEDGSMVPFYFRYFDWLTSFVVGDFGDSQKFKVPVGEVMWPRLWNTLILGGATFAIMVPLALALGILSGMKEGSLLDRGVSVFCILTTSVPEFASAVVLSAVFVFYLGLLPGTSSMIGGFSVVELILPTMVLVGYGFGYIARMTRASMAEVMTTHYIRTAVLKGLPYKRVVMKHALRNALIAPFTVIILQIPWLLSGVIVVEVFFAYKGFGALLLEASLFGDIYVIEACAMVAVFVVVLTQVISDIGYTYLNPRIRFS